MNLIFSRSRELLVGTVSAAALLLSASPAAAMLYTLEFKTATQSGVINFTAPDWTKQGLPGEISSVSVTDSYVITNASKFNDSGVKESVVSIVPAGSFSNVANQQNDNVLKTFTPDVPATLPTSDDYTTWFGSGGFAVKLADNTVIDLFVKQPNNSRNVVLDVESLDTSNHTIVSQGTAILIDAPAAGPKPAAGLLGLAGLLICAAALRLRDRMAAR
ncbi:hypothetical protein [Methylocystis bryophila]|uniref:PEP-CTERM sorting domain-containing protein n=1 Tax=Methylocystis bryophila TaxID=655015 RepID=A0A1W6MYX3_9HYPH|nr:hypothetical protein [Methylocystis bryophila]ARN82800.1 hypothetical protein B1812_18790 [Methylocystis bryophila]